MPKAMSTMLGIVLSSLHSCFFLQVRNVILLFGFIIQEVPFPPVRVWSFEPRNVVLGKISPSKKKKEKANRERGVGHVNKIGTHEHLNQMRERSHWVLPPSDK